MSAPEPKFDAELAWDIQEWNDESLDERREVRYALSRNDIKLLAEFLTGKGYAKGGKSGGIGGLLTSLEDVGVKLADEVGPLIDTLRKRA